MKASIILLAASAGIALAQPTSLAELDHTESPLCPWFGDDNPLQPTPACCYNIPWTQEHYPYKVCMARKLITPITIKILSMDQILLTCIENIASSAQNITDFEASCRKINEEARPVCCPQSLITDDPSENKGDFLLCHKAKTVN